jgi:hypothetical protein
MLCTKLASFTRIVGYTLRLHFCPARDEEERGFEHILTRVILKTPEILLDPQPIWPTREKHIFTWDLGKNFPHYRHLEEVEVVTFFKPKCLHTKNRIYFFQIYEFS